MVISSIEQAHHYLQFIGYYRLSGYWFHFQYRDGSARHDHFQPSTSFNDVLTLYIFDRKLRLILMDALERLEVAVRTAMASTLSMQHGSHWYLQPQHFSPSYNHAVFVERVKKDIHVTNKHHQAPFVRHYFETYSSPELPPCWMVFELLSFGTVSILFENLATSHRQTIAQLFTVAPDKLNSWLHALSHLRNVCAHHERVWNRVFGISPTIPKSQRSHVRFPKKLYAHAIIIQILLKTVSGDTHWAERLAGLFAEYPEINLIDMGFPENWYYVWQSF